MKIDQTIYQEISDQKEFLTLAKKLVQSSSVILVHYLNDKKNFFTVKAIGLSETQDGALIRVQILSKTPLELEPSFKPVTYHFSSEDKKIIGSGEFGRDEPFWQLIIKLPCFYVQRRNHFRLRLPSDYIAECVINYSGQKKKYRIIDISAGGFLMEADDSSIFLKLHQTFHAELLFPGKEVFAVKVMVMREPTSQNKKAGLKFIFSDKSMEREMVGFVIELYRRFFK